MTGVHRPLELILARNLLASLSTPAFLVDNGGVIAFYNDAAGRLLGRRFEEHGPMPAHEWTTTFGPFDAAGEPVRFDNLDITSALRGNRPAHDCFCIRDVDGTNHSIEASALPIVGGGGHRAARSSSSGLSTRRREGPRLGRPRVRPGAGRGDDALRRQHVLRAGRALRREHPRARRGDVEIRELPCAVSFRECEGTEWMIGPATVRAESVAHRGPTLGFRVEDAGTSLCYIPDHEPGLGAHLDDLPDEWISGLDLARGVDLLLHDAQYTDEEYPAHLGWGHSPIADTLSFARRAGAGRLLGFHHDPLHTDRMLDALCADASTRWIAAGGARGGFGLAAEGTEIDLLPRVPTV